jgi:hypothetical protein
MGMIWGCSSTLRESTGITLGTGLSERLRIGSAPALRAADHSLGYQRVNFICGIAEFGEHLGRVLAEGRRDAAQAGLAALEADRGRHALVPIFSMTSPR